MPPPPPPRAQTAFGYQQKFVLWVAMMASAAMYFVVIRMVPVPERETTPMLLGGLLAVALGLVALSFLVKGRLVESPAGKTPEGRAKAAFVVPLVMCEAASLCGVVAWFVAGSRQAYYLLLLGAAGLLLHYPRRED